MEGYKTDEHRKNWRYVDKHIALSDRFGYCSAEARLVNTYLDASFLQGILYGSRRNLGNVVQTDRTIAGEIFTWDVDSGCYKSGRKGSPEINAACDATIAGDLSSGLPMRKWNKPDKLDTGQSLIPKPTGTFHPTVLGHCAYAAALVDSMNSILSLSDLPVIQEGIDPLETLKNFCSEEQLLYEYTGPGK